MKIFAFFSTEGSKHGTGAESSLCGAVPLCRVRRAGARGAGELCEWGCEWGGDYKVVCVRGLIGVKLVLAARGAF